MSTETGSDAVTVVRQIGAPAAAVYDAFMNPDQLMRWMGPKRWHATEVKIDPREGGFARIAVEADDGERGSFDWQYVELIPAEKIEISFAFGGPDWEVDSHRSRFTITLVELGPDSTELTLAHDRLGQAPPGGHTGVNQGWNEAIDKLVAVVEEDHS